MQFQTTTPPMWGKLKNRSILFHGVTSFNIKFRFYGLISDNYHDVHFCIKKLTCLSMKGPLFKNLTRGETILATTKKKKKLWILGHNQTDFFIFFNLKIKVSKHWEMSKLFILSIIPSHFCFIYIKKLFMIF